MSTSIRISDETKQKLEAVKREDESFDELLSRLARTEKDVEEMGGWLDPTEGDDLAKHVGQKRAELNESPNNRQGRVDDRS